MYTDSRPCEVCGSQVRLEPREPQVADPDQLVGPPDGVVGGGDPTVDVRVCTDPGCPSHAERR